MIKQILHSNTHQFQTPEQLKQPAIGGENSQESLGPSNGGFSRPY